MNVCCIIKPDGLQHSTEIIRLLISSGIPVCERKRMTYTKELVDQLYNHMSTGARAQIKTNFVGKCGLALLVRAPSIRRLLAVAGVHSDPRQCAPNSIRFRFGTHGIPERIDDWDWWDNAFHRPVDMREAKRDLNLFFPS